MNIPKIADYTLDEELAALIIALHAIDRRGLDNRLANQALRSAIVDVKLDLKDQRIH